ncbi:MAG: YqeG family HAD IIIA-type phosphatase [Oscillospiraceae bacterium]
MSAFLYIKIDLKGRINSMLFKPKYVFNSISDITAEFLKSQNIKGLLLDLDNTLTTHNNPIPPESSLDWLDSMKAAGIKLMIVSNNSAERVTPFAKQLDVNFVPRGKKPLPVGYNRACKRLGIEKTQLASVGDQIFTDVLGSNLAGIRSIFVFPIEPETSLPFRIKRFAERPFLPEKIGE